MSRMVTINDTAQPSPAWETELILLSGGDRAELLQVIADLQAFLQTSPQLRLTDLAFTLNVQECHHPVRLAVVAKSVSDLAEKLQRTAEKLADAKCKQIRDVQGIFFAGEPLGHAGKLAVLFPGEGARLI